MSTSRKYISNHSCISRQSLIINFANVWRLRDYKLAPPSSVILTFYCRELSFCSVQLNSTDVDFPNANRLVNEN